MTAAGSSNRNDDGGGGGGGGGGSSSSTHRHEVQGHGGDRILVHVQRGGNGSLHGAPRRGMLSSDKAVTKSLINAQRQLTLQSSAVRVRLRSNGNVSVGSEQRNRSSRERSN